MFPSEYEVREHQRDLLRQAEQHRFAKHAAHSVSLAQHAGNGLLRLGAALTYQKHEACHTIETRGNIVTVCAA